MNLVAARRWAQLAVAVAAFAGAAWLASSLPAPPPVGIPDPGLVTRWGIPIATVVRDLSVSTVIGLAVIGLLMRSGLAPATHRVLGRAALAGALSSLVAVAALYLLTASDVYSLPVADLLDPSRLGDLHDETEIGRRLVQQIVLWLLAVVALIRAHPVGRAVSLALALTSLVPWAYGGHSAGMGDHELAVYSVLLHLVGVTVWCGGLVALVWAARLEPALTASLMRRFSPVALGAFVVVAASGVVASWSRLADVSALWDTGYGRLILLKAGLLLVLGGFGAWHRGAVLRRTADARAVTASAMLLVVGVEVLVMSGAMGVAVALSRTPMS